MSDIRVGVIGVGVMGAGHARYLTEHVDGAVVTALFDLDGPRMDSLAKELSAKSGAAINQHASVEALVSEANVDAVIICSPDGLHPEHLTLAINAGKHTLCEKPLAPKSADAKKVADLANASGLNITLGFMRRFDASYREVKRLIDTGDYGKPTFFRTITRNVASTGATTPGLFTNIAIHDFDIFRWLFKDEWVSVQSHYPRKSSLSPEGIADPLVITAFMKSGIMMLADIVAFNNYGYDVRTEVICEKGSIEIGINGDVITRANRVMGAHTGGKMEENWIPRFTESYIEELRAWVQALLTGEVNSDLATVDDALAANEVCALGVASI